MAFFYLRRLQSKLPFMARKDRINMSRREYHICINLNDIFITKVVIDSHYEAKHNESINDEIIFTLPVQSHRKSLLALEKTLDRAFPFA